MESQATLDTRHRMSTNKIKKIQKAKQNGQHDPTKKRRFNKSQSYSK